MFMPFSLLSGLQQAARRAMRRPRHREDRGASAVEFALVSPLLFALLFGTIDYGLYFADVLTVQQGVADAAREATLSVGSVAPNWPGDPSCITAPAAVLNVSATMDLAKVACRVSDTVTPIAGSVLAVKAEIVTPNGTSDETPTAIWWSATMTTNRLRVCAMTKHTAALPFVPLPGGGVITSRVEMPVQPGNAPLLLNPVAEAPVPGTDWSWC